MNEEYIDNVKHLIEQKDADKVKGLLIDLHPADIAELCNDLNPEEAKFIYRLLDNEIAADVLVEMDEDARKELLEMLPSETIAKRFVDYMDTDDAVDLMRELDEDKQEEVLSHIEDIEQAGDIVDLLKYDENTAGGLMGTEMVLVNENWSMPECLKEMRQQAEELDEIYYVYVIDDDERLRGIFPLKKMITSPSVSKVKHVMQKDPISVHVDTPIDEVVQAIEKYDLVAIPVVDSIGRLVGQITVDDVMDEVREQSERDYQLASGLSQDVETDDNVLRQTTARLPWLLIGMIGGIGNSMILGNFDSTFAAHPEMALYIPLIGGTGGNVGTQSSAIIVQGLANSSLDAKNTFKQITKESVVALINATIISLLVYTYNFIRFGATATVTYSVSIILFAVVVALACVTTAVGLVSACADYFSGLSGGRVSYRTLVCVICVFSAVVSNFGLNEIIAIASPILSVVYPPTLVLIVLALFGSRIRRDWVFRLAALGALAVSLLEVVRTYTGVELAFLDLLPLASLDFGWVLPAAVCGAVGALIPGGRTAAS